MMPEKQSPLKISLINGICVRRDAISQSMHGTAVALNNVLGAHCKIFTYAFEYDDVPHRVVTEPTQILTDQHFQESDIIIYHFGIYYDLFNTIFLKPQRSKIIVRFHNITPKEFVPENSRRLTDRSLAQRANIDQADEIWADSLYNKQDLIDFGINPDKIIVSPLYVKFSETPQNQGKKPDDVVELLYVGRFVQSKGVLDLVSAVVALRETAIPFRLRLVGNIKFSDPVYIEKIRTSIAMHGLQEVVIFEGSVTDEELRLRYASADIFVIPSYHEGFCVPLIEAMRYGCVPIGYKAGNISSLVADNGVVVPTGNVAALSQAIAAVAQDLRDERRSKGRSRIDWGGSNRSWSKYRSNLASYVKQFEFESYAQHISSRVRSTIAGK